MNCGLCLPDKPCGFERCPNDTVLAADYNALLSRLSRAEALLDRARVLIENAEFHRFVGCTLWLKDYEESRRG